MRRGGGPISYEGSSASHASPFRPHRGVYLVLGVLGVIGTAAYETRKAIGWELSVAIVAGVFAAMWLVGFGFRIYCTRAQRALNARAAEGLRSGLPIVLYLRPFMSGGNLFVRNALGTADRFLMGWYWDAELALSLALEGKARLIAVGGGEDSVGAAKLKVEDADWVRVMQDCAERAAAIIAVPLNRPSTLWEMQHLLSHPWLLAKTLFFMPPGDHGAMAREWWQEGQKNCLGFGLELPDYRVEGGWVRVNPKGAWSLVLPLFGMRPQQSWTMICAVFAGPGQAMGKDDDYAGAARQIDLRLQGIFEETKQEFARIAEEQRKREGKPPPQTLREQFKDLLRMIAIVAGLIVLLFVGIILYFTFLQ